MSHLIHPRPAAGRQKTPFGIVFHDGHADHDLEKQPHLRDALIQHGYTIEETSESDSAVRPSKASKSSKAQTDAEPKNVADTPQESPAEGGSGDTIDLPVVD